MRNDLKAILIVQMWHTVMLAISLTLTFHSCTAKASEPESYSISVLDSNGANRNLVIVEVEQAGRTRSFLVHKDELEKPDTIEAIAQEVERGTH